MAKNKKWVVITNGKRDLKEISADLVKHGFTVEYELDAIGQITGEAGEDFKEKAQKIAGVDSITAAGGDIHLGDPNSSETW